MQRYFLAIVLAPLAALLIIATANRVIDPYQIFSADRQAVFSDKPALHANMRLHKAFQTRLQKPDTLILGSSKAIQGLPTQHALFGDGRMYNLAMPLASMKELTYLLRHANDITPSTQVILALDFLSFNAMARQDGPAAGFQPARLAGHDQSHALPFTDYLAATISLDAILASVDAWKVRGTLTAPVDVQISPPYRVMTGLGGRLDAEIRSRLNDGGHRSNTLKIEEFFTNAVYLPAPHRQFSFASSEQDSLYWFEQFLRTLHQNNVKSSLFISPSHARLNELIDAAGLWPLYEQWKQRMLSLTTQIAKEFGQEPYTLWDFSAPGDITTEPFPEAGDSDYQMRYYYESIHFNQRTGARVLDRLLQGENFSTSAEALTPVFGQVLTTENIDAVLMQNRTLQKSFSEQFPEYREELNEIVQGR